MKKIILAGFGGQGVLSMGQFITLSGLMENKEVSYLPAYGPEMRGGTANCSVVIADKAIASPLCSTPDILVAMNLPSLKKFEDKVVKNGIIILNSSLIKEEVKRKDIIVYKIPANDLAAQAGTVKAANMVMTGAVQAVTEIVSEKSIYECINERFGSKPKLIDINKKAYLLGVNAAKTAN